MKKQAYMIIIGLFLTTCFAITTANAQSLKQQWTADISFEFTAGGETLPAGRYSIAIISQQSEQTAIKFTNVDTRQSALLMMRQEEVAGDEKPQLVFHQYGTHYFFAQAKTTGLSLNANRSRAELTVARELAGIKRHSETIALSR